MGPMECLAQALLKTHFVQRDGCQRDPGAPEEAGIKRRHFFDKTNNQFKPHNSWIRGHSQCFLVKSQGWSRLVIFLSLLVQSPPFSSQRHVRWLDSFCWHNPNTFPPVVSHNYGKSPFIVKCPMKNGGSFHIVM